MLMTITATACVAQRLPRWDATWNDMNKLMASRALFTVNAIGVAVGGFIADWTPTHIFNPNWPPHAKFHCRAVGQGRRRGWCAVAA
jgi:hypothetical protein